MLRCVAAMWEYQPVARRDSEDGGGGCRDSDATDGGRGKSLDLPGGSTAAAGHGNLRQRAGVLVTLLVFQSCTSFVIASYSDLLHRHPVIVAFLTMLVGAGGNAGNQAAVLVIRGLALGEITSRSQGTYLWREAKMSIKIALVVVICGFVRVLLFQYPLSDAVAISASLAAIVFTSIVGGASLPLALQQRGFDPAHAGPTIQVLMDLFGVAITCAVCSVLLSERGPSQLGGEAAEIPRVAELVGAAEG